MCRPSFLLPLALVTAIAACNTATVESSWRAPSAPTLTNVITLSPASDVTLRRSAEDKLAQQLSQHGVRAIPAYQVLSDQELGDQAHLAQALSARGFDGIVTMRFVDASQQMSYYPEFEGYWGNTWGEALPETVVRIQVNAYALPGKKLVASEMSKSVDPMSARQVIVDVSKVATDRMASQHVIGPAQAAAR